MSARGGIDIQKKELRSVLLQRRVRLIKVYMLKGLRIRPIVAKEGS